ncbi:DNRLRE domain-containing protein, partial [Actinokineospora sp.]|uniref:DNRLRE domain-containing protein n=1 Tax=Actinokineospora sp. TaxID=1872133 RepID=UPI003D6A0747
MIATGLTPRMRASIFGSLLVIGASLVVPGVASASPSVVGAQPVVALDTETAQAQARLLNKQVKVTAKTTESSETWANPDGTLTSEIASGPVRVKQGDDWNPVDLTLVKQPDGTVRAKAHPRNLVLSAASGPGTEDLASVSSPHGMLALQWPGSLPDPMLNGDTATYAEVEPGVDLQVKATLAGFQQLLVVKRKPTKAMKATLPLRVEGMEVRTEASGHIALLDKSGRVVGGIPAAEMWDSRKDSTTGDRVKHVKAKQLTVKRAGPQQSGVDITVEPADAFFDDPGLVYPVSIDPSPDLGTSFDTWVQEGSTLQKSASTELRMGVTGSAETRAYMHFDMSPIKGTTVTASTLRLWAFHSYSCSARNWTVYSTPLVAWDVTWATKPAPWNEWVTTSETMGYDSSCAADSTKTDIQRLAQTWADQKFGMAGVMIRATDETDALAWKKFNSSEAGLGPIPGTLGSGEDGHDCGWWACQVFVDGFLRWERGALCAADHA